MHYYKRNLGDYAKKAGRLSMLQHGAYTLLIDACYDREEFPTLEQAYKWAWAATSEEKQAVAFVLDMFFDLGGDGRYSQNRIQEEIDTYHRNCAINSRIATERENKRKPPSTKQARTVIEARTEHHEPPPNHKPVTNNQEPEKDIPPIPPKGGDGKPKKSAVELRTYLAACKEAGVKAVPEDNPVFDYAEKVGIPQEFLRLQWMEFRDRYSEEGSKRYKAWATVFNKSVRGNWFKIWYFDNNGQCLLTTVGIQAKNAHEGAA